MNAYATIRPAPVRSPALDAALASIAALRYRPPHVAVARVLLSQPWRLAQALAGREPSQALIDALGGTITAQTRTIRDRGTYAFEAASARIQARGLRLALRVMRRRGWEVM